MASEDLRTDIDPADRDIQDWMKAGSRRLWPYMRRRWAHYALGAVMLAITNLLLLTAPYLLSKMVEVLEGDNMDVARLWRLFLSVLAVALLGAGARVTSRLLIFNTGRMIEYELRKKIFEHAQRMSASVFARRATGDLVSRATNDLGSVRLLFGFGMLNLMNTPILFVLAIGVMLWINPRLTPAVLAIYPVVILGVRSYSRRMFGQTQRVQTTLGEISAAAQENFSAIQVIKSYGLEGREIEKMRVLSERYLSQNVKLALTRNVLFNVMAAVIGLSELVLLAYGGWEIIQGRLTKGELVAFNIYLGMMIWPTMAFGFILSVWQRGMAAMSRIEEVLLEPTEEGVTVPVPDEPWTNPEFWKKDLEVSGLTWGYPVEEGPVENSVRSEPVLKELNMRIRGGAFTALIGPTGCGKSTLTRLLSRLHNPPEGTVTVGGVDINGIPLEVLRSHLGVASQEAFLFSRTLAENIRFGRPDAGQDEVAASATYAGLARDLEEFPKGFETVVGERGITLSGGQRQRTAIARLMVFGGTIVILDDSLSAVDLETEERILANLRSQLAGRTVLMITHRIATARDADWIYVMDQGRIVEEGAHDQLMGLEGLYARLAEIQHESRALGLIR